MGSLQVQLIKAAANKTPIHLQIVGCSQLDSILLIMSSCNQC